MGGSYVQWCCCGYAVMVEVRQGYESWTVNNQMILCYYLCQLKVCDIDDPVPTLDQVLVSTSPPEDPVCAVRSKLQVGFSDVNIGLAPR
jgi:hypothetical protein